MPLTYLSHQSVVIPLKIAAPRAVSGTALVLGSIAPDVNYYLEGYASNPSTHSWPAQLTFCLPVTLALYWLVTRVIAVPLAAHLPDAGSFRLHDYALVANQPSGPGHWLTVAISAVIGSATHVLLDRYTGGWSRSYGSSAWPPGEWLPSDAAWIAAQIGTWIVLGVITIVQLRKIGRERLLRRWASARGLSDRPAAAGAVRPWAFWIPIAFTALVGATLATLIVRPGYHYDEPATWIHIALGIISGAFVGLVATSAWWRLAVASGSTTAGESA
jgi:hypothetical protein